METGSDVRDFVSHWRQDPTGRDDELVVAKVKYESVARVARWRESNDEDAAQGIVEDTDDDAGGFSDSEQRHLRQHWTPERSPLHHVRPQSASNTRRNGDSRAGERSVGQRRPQSASASRRGGDLSSPQRKLQQLMEFAWMPAEIQRSKWTEMLHSSPGFQEQSLQRLEAETYALLKKVLEKRPATGVKREKKSTEKAVKKNSLETGARHSSQEGSLAVGSGLQVVRKSKSKAEKVATANSGGKPSTTTSEGSRTKTTQPTRVQQAETKALLIKDKKKPRAKPAQQNRVRSTKATAAETKLTGKELMKRHADAEARLRLMQEMGWLDDVGLRKSPSERDAVADEETPPVKKTKKKKAKAKTKGSNLTEKALRYEGERLANADDDDVDCLIQDLLLEVPRDPCCEEAVLSHETEATWSDATVIRRHCEADDDTGSLPDSREMSALTIEVAEAPSGTTAVSDESVIVNFGCLPDEKASEPRYSHAHLSRSNTERYEDDSFEEEPARQTIGCDQEEVFAGEQFDCVASSKPADAHVSVTQEKPKDAPSASNEVPQNNSVDDCLRREVGTTMEVMPITPCESHQAEVLSVTSSEGIEGTTELRGCEEAARAIQHQYRVFRNRRMLLDQVRFLVQKQRRKKRTMSRRPSSSTCSVVTTAIVVEPTLGPDHVNEEVEWSRQEAVGASDAGGEELQEDAKDVDSLSPASPVDELPSAGTPADTFIADDGEGLRASSERLFHGIEPALIQDQSASSSEGEHRSLTGVGIQVARAKAQEETDSASHHAAAAHALVATDDSTSNRVDAGRSYTNDATQGEDSAAVVSCKSSDPLLQVHESCVAGPQEENVHCVWPSSEATDVHATPLVLSESNETTDDREERDQIPHNGVQKLDHSDCVVMDAVGGGCLAGGGIATSEEVSGSSSVSVVVRLDEAELTGLEEKRHRDAVAESLSFDGEVTADHEQARVDAAERIQQCWKHHRSPDEKEVITEDHATMEVLTTHGSGSAEDALSRTASVEIEFTPSLCVTEVNSPTTEESEASYCLPSKPSEEEYPAAKTREGSALDSDLEGSDATAMDNASVCEPYEGEIESANATSVSVLEDRSIVQHHPDEAVGGASSVPSTQPGKEALAVVRIQCQYRRFVYRRALLDQLGFVVRQHRRESRRKTRRLSADAAVVSAVLEPVNETIRTEDAREALPEQPVTMAAIVETVDAELRPASPDIHPAETTPVSDGVAERRLLEAAFESAPDSNDGGDATTAKTQPADLDNHTINLASSSGVAENPADQGANEHGEDGAKSTDGEPRTLEATWERHMDTSANKSFYFHATHRVSQWDRPVGGMVVDKATEQATAVQEAVVASTDNEVASTTSETPSTPSHERWERYMDSDTNQSFYFHPNRRVSRWDRPDQEPVVDCVADTTEAPSELLAGEPLTQDANTEAASRLQSWWQHAKDQATLLETNGGCDRYLTREDAVVFYHHAGRDEFRLESDSGVPEEFTQAKTALLDPTDQGTTTRWTLRRNRSLQGDKRGEWQAFVDTETHQTFYYNTLTGESTWEKPLAFQQQQPTLQHASAGYKWVMYVDPTTAQPYYVNLATNATSWEKPRDFDEATSARDLSRLRGIGEHAGVVEPMTDGDDEDADVEQDEYVISIHDDRGADEWLAA